MGAKKRSDVPQANPLSRPDPGDDAASSPEPPSDPTDVDYFPSDATTASGSSRLPRKAGARAQPKSRSTNRGKRLGNIQAKEHRPSDRNNQHSFDVQVKTKMGAKKTRNDVTPARPPRTPDPASSPEPASDPKDVDYFPSTKAEQPSRLPRTTRARAQPKRLENIQTKKDRRRDRKIRHSPRDVEGKEEDNTAVEEVDRMLVLATVAASMHVVTALDSPRVM